MSAAMICDVCVGRPSTLDEINVQQDFPEATVAADAVPTRAATTRPRVSQPTGPEPEANQRWIMRNVHERHIGASAERVGAVLQTLATDDDQL